MKIFFHTSITVLFLGYFPKVMSQQAESERDGSQSNQCRRVDLRTFAPKIFHIQIFLKLQLQVESDKIRYWYLLSATLLFIAIAQKIEQIRRYYLFR